MHFLVFFQELFAEYEGVVDAFMVWDDPQAHVGRVGHGRKEIHGGGLIDFIRGDVVGVSPGVGILLEVWIIDVGPVAQRRNHAKDHSGYAHAEYHGLGSREREDVQERMADAEVPVQGYPDHDVRREGHGRRDEEHVGLAGEVVDQVILPEFEDNRIRNSHQTGQEISPWRKK